MLNFYAFWTLEQQCNHDVHDRLTGTSVP